MRFLIVAMFLFVTACQDGPAAPGGSLQAVAIGDGFTLAVGETASLDDANLLLTFNRVVQDSRCPSDVQCVWAGSGQIEIFARSGWTRGAFTLSTNDGSSHVSIGSYRISLLALNPAPVSTQPIPVESYRAALTVSKRGPERICAVYAAAALNVEIRDSVTGAVPELTGLAVIARAGTYADSVKLTVFPLPHYGGPIALAYEHSGTYSVTVRADGYAPWIRSGIVVTRDECHVIPVSITARLAR